MQRLRIYLTGVGGQGTLTATSLLSRIALDAGLQVVSGEIHGMAQRGGVVESTILLGGWQSPSIHHGEADIILGFEALETYRALPYLKEGGAIFSSTDYVPPPGVNMGRESLPPFSMIEQAVRTATTSCVFLSLKDIGMRCGNIQSGNSALLAALCASGLTPISLDALRQGIQKYLPAKVVEANLQAVDLGAAARS